MNNMCSHTAAALAIAAISVTLLGVAHGQEPPSPQAWPPGAWVAAGVDPPLPGEEQDALRALLGRWRIDWTTPSQPQMTEIGRAFAAMDPTEGIVRLWRYDLVVPERAALALASWLRRLREPGVDDGSPRTGVAAATTTTPAAQRSPLQPTTPGMDDGSQPPSSGSSSLHQPQRRLTLAEIRARVEEQTQAIEAANLRLTSEGPGVELQESPVGEALYGLQDAVSRGVGAASSIRHRLAVALGDAQEEVNRPDLPAWRRTILEQRIAARTADLSEAGELVRRLDAISLEVGRMISDYRWVRNQCDSGGNDEDLQLAMESMRAFVATVAEAAVRIRQELTPENLD